MALSTIILIFNYDSMNLRMNTWNVVDNCILKLIYKPNVKCLVVDNTFLVDNCHNLIYECGIFQPVVDNTFLGDLFENNIIYNLLNFSLWQYIFKYEYLKRRR